jgi:hypothetical protein
MLLKDIGYILGRPPDSCFNLFEWENHPAIFDDDRQGEKSPVKD